MVPWHEIEVTAEHHCILLARKLLPPGHMLVCNPEQLESRFKIKIK
jgi:hypothetical protein